MSTAALRPSEASDRFVRERGILLQPDPRGDDTSCECTKIGFKRFFLDAKRQIFRRSNLFLVSLLILQTSVLVLQKVLSLHAGNYPYVLTVTQPICTTVSFGTLWLMAKLYKLSLSSSPSNIVSSNNIQQSSVPPSPMAGESIPILSPAAEDQPLRAPPAPQQSALSFPIWKYAVIGALLILANFLNYAGARGTFLSGPVVVLLQQATIPVTLFISILVLKTSYGWAHFVGALVILVGIAVSVMPELRKTQSVTLWAMALIVAGTVPQVCAILIMEYSYKYKRMRLLFSWTLINLFEFLAALPLVFAIVPLQHISIRAIPEYLRDGYMCLLSGDNTRSGDDCRLILLAWIVYIIALVGNKLNLSLVITRNSSSLLWVVLTAAVPLANILFCFGFVLGEHKSSFTIWSVTGLVVVVCGLILYRCVPEPHRSDRKASKDWWTREWREA